MDITPEYINNVQETGKGKEAIILASQVAVDVYLEKDLSYLEGNPLIEKSNICFMSDVTQKTFVSELKKYIKEMKDLFST